MRRLPPPLRFLAIAVGGWACMRAAILVPGPWLQGGEAAPRLAQAAPVTPITPALPRDPAAAEAGTRVAVKPMMLPTGQRAAALSRAPGTAAWTRSSAPDLIAERELETPSPGMVAAPHQLFPVLTPAFAVPASTSRWSASAWLLARRERAEGTLAPGGTLGGSQAGARFLYRLNDDAARPLAFSARFYTPLRQRGGAEAAAGLDWRPFGGLPLHILAERREALGRDGRSAFSLTVYGGGSGRIGRQLNIDAYAQAGMVGVRSKDSFFDGAVRLGVPVGRLEIGGGAWAAAQPGVERVDVGPQLSVRLPGSEHVRLRADWRFRIAGDAAPGSGPAITVASDF